MLELAMSPPGPAVQTYRFERHYKLGEEELQADRMHEHQRDQGLGNQQHQHHIYRGNSENNGEHFGGSYGGGMELPPQGVVLVSVGRICRLVLPGLCFE